MRTRTLIVHVDWASSKIISFGDSFPTVKPRSLYIWFKRTFLIVTVPMSSFEVILSSGCNAWYSWSKYSGFSNRSRNTLSFVARFAVVCVADCCFHVHPGVLLYKCEFYLYSLYPVRNDLARYFVVHIYFVCWNSL